MRTGFWINNFFNFANKVVGFFRTNIKLMITGDRYISDIFLLADKNVSLFRRLFVDGNFQSIFINHYAKEKNQGTEKIFTFLVLKQMTILLFGVTLLFTTCVLIMKFIFFDHLLFLVNNNRENLNLFFLFSIGLSPLILLIFYMSFFTALLNANGDFKYSAPAPFVGNLFYVLILFLFSKGLFPGSLSFVMVLGAIAYAVFQCAFMFSFAKKYIVFENKTLAINHHFKNDIIKGLSINLLVPFSEILVGFLALKQQGMFSHIEYGHKYIYVLFSIVAVPIATSIIPSLSKKNAEKDHEKFQNESKQAFLLTHMLAIPITVFLVFFTEDLVLKMVKNLTNIALKEDLSRTFAIISSSLYFLMQNRILNSIANASDNLNANLKGSIVFGLTQIIFAFLLIKWKFGLAISGNIAYALQFGFLIYYLCQKKILSFNYIDYGKILFSFIYSVMGIYLFKKHGLIYGGLFISSYLYLFKQEIKILFSKES